MKNLDKDTVKSFSDQWVRYDQSGMNDNEAKKIFKSYWYNNYNLCNFHAFRNILL